MVLHIFVWVDSDIFVCVVCLRSSRLVAKQQALIHITFVSRAALLNTSRKAIDWCKREINRIYGFHVTSSNRSEHKLTILSTNVLFANTLLSS